MLNPDTRVAIITSHFNTEITDKLREGTVTTLLNAGLAEANLFTVSVPGAVEIPLIAKVLAAKKKYQAIICLGAVIRGETDHHKYVCEQVSQGCLQVMLEFTTPVLFGVLTTENEQQAWDRVSKPENHKGIEVAEAAISMINLMREL